MYNDSELIAAFAAISIFIFFFAIVAYVVTSFFLMKIFEKAGVQGKWRAWVPVYNTLIFAKLGDVSPWAVLAGLGAAALLGWIPLLGWIISLVPAVLMAMAAWRVGMKLQKEPVWVVLFLLVGAVWMGILAFDKSAWNTNIPPTQWAKYPFLVDTTEWEGIPKQTSGGLPPYSPPAPSAS